jgi:uncharacterized protein (DUF1501 family)
MDRRSILKALTGGLIFPVVPIAIANAAQKSGKRLILIELQGANDGLNTVVPYKHELYKALRPNIHLQSEEIIPLDEKLALNSSMNSFAEIWDMGELAIVLGLGYPGANRSHFKSIALWETGGDGMRGVENQGWLTEDIIGYSGSTNPDVHGISLDGGMGVFASPKGNWVSMTSIRKFTTLKHHEQIASTVDNPALSLLLDRSNSLNSSMQRISKKLNLSDRYFNVRGGDLGDQFQMALNCIEANINTPVIKLSHGGFDTHENQKRHHNRLLKQLSDAIFDTRKYLIQLDEWDNTIIMTYSEFGRRAYENFNQGTDHGTAAPHFITGGAVEGGFFGKQPSLDKLEDNDLVFTTDYRSVYDSILSAWFSVESNKFKAFRLEDVARIFKV